MIYPDILPWNKSRTIRLWEKTTLVDILPFLSAVYFIWWKPGLLNGFQSIMKICYSVKVSFLYLFFFFSLSRAPGLLSSLVLAQSMIYGSQRWISGWISTSLIRQSISLFGGVFTWTVPIDQTPQKVDYQHNHRPELRNTSHRSMKTIPHWEPAHCMYEPRLLWGEEWTEWISLGERDEWTVR